MPLGVVMAVGEDLRALDYLRDTLATTKYTAVVQNPEYPHMPPKDR